MNKLQKLRSRWYYTCSAVMWLGIAGEIYGWLSSSYLFIVIFLIVTYSGWALQSVVFTSANYNKTPDKEKDDE